MQIEVLKNVSRIETNHYLRIASVDNKVDYCCLYIGSDPKSSDLLMKNFNGGLVIQDFESAKKILSSINTTIDVIILDISCSEKSVRDFSSFLQGNGLRYLPIVLSHKVAVNNSRIFDIVDDVVDLTNESFDLSKKIAFLKRMKEYDCPVEMNESYLKITDSFAKRFLDVSLALSLILLLLPLFLIIIVAIKLETKGPIIYKAKRAGRGFKIFNFYKFRTMVVNADKKVQELIHLNQYSNDARGAHFFKVSNDPRITKVGRFLRNTSLDELPQLFNVIKGDMSLVGNRPLPLYEAATLTTNEFVERFMAPAGITGLWQIKKRGKADMSAEERISLDISYVKKSSLLYDLWIIVNTPRALMQKSDV